MADIEVMLNGAARRVPIGWTVADLLSELGLRREGVAVAIGSRVVPRGQHGERVLAEGDQVEVITAVGGG